MNMNGTLLKRIIIIAVPILFIAFVTYFPPVFAQEGSNNTSLGNIINNQFYNGGVFVWSESPNTLILTLEFYDGSPAAQIIDLAKQYGLKIESVTESVRPSSINPEESNAYYTIFFSR